MNANSLPHHGWNGCVTRTVRCATARSSAVDGEAERLRRDLRRDSLKTELIATGPGSPKHSSSSRSSNTSAGSTTPAALSDRRHPTRRVRGSRRPAVASNDSMTEHQNLQTQSPRNPAWLTGPLAAHRPPDQIAPANPQHTKTREGRLGPDQRRPQARSQHRVDGWPPGTSVRRQAQPGRRALAPVRRAFVPTASRS